MCLAAATGAATCSYKKTRNRWLNSLLMVLDGYNLWYITIAFG